MTAILDDAIAKTRSICSIDGVRSGSSFNHRPEGHVMGLDSYAFVTEFADSGLEHAQSFYYWRKHDNLDAWAMRLAKEKRADIEAIEEYCTFSLPLEPRDIDRLEAEIESGRLYDGMPPHYQRRFLELRDRDFVSKARLAFSAGLHVIYASDF